MLLLARFVRVIVLAGMLSGTAQAQSAIPIDSLPPNGLQLRTGWRWHPGNNPAWASPSFDDHRWDTIRPGKSILELPQFRKAPMGWFRLRFELDSAVAKIPLSLGVSQAGASEIYLDGSLFRQMGKVGLTYRQERAYTPSSWERYPLPPLSAGRHVLAVRLSRQQPPWYAPKLIYFTSFVFAAKVFSTEEVTGRVARQTYLRTLANYLIVGLFLMLSGIHYLYYAYRRQRINLVFGLTTLFCSIVFALGDTLNVINDSLVADWMFFGQRLSLALFMVLLLATYYIYLKRPLSWLFWLTAAGLLLPEIGVSFFNLTSTFLDFTNSVFNISLGVLFIDGIHISVVAMRNQQPNARLILNSLLILLVILLIGNTTDYWLRGWLPIYIGYSVSVMDILFFITLPISFAVILARDYAQTNRDLQNQLGEVQRLSTEKQQLLAQQNETLEYQVKQRTTELTQSLTNLRDTQQQLVLREKMASLGELTAGIAHEIQNPLHFVNNFAEVSVELVEELRDEREKGDKRDEALEIEILTDLGQNLEKISQHGGRASGIVRGMLEHARPSAGEREPTDLNALTDEYLKLAYHGLRAKDNAFDAQLVTHFDSNSSPVMVVPQELGRVLLNLFNNAFYATQERATQERAVLENQQTGVTPYQPTVTVQTKQLPDTVEISVSDNGSGIPEAIREKVFNPFFTTKPTGQGTGLGLSLSYDLITKGHNGTLTFETTINEGTTFTIRLPVATNQP